MTIHIGELVSAVTLERGGQHGPGCPCPGCARPDLNDPAVVKRLSDRVYGLMRTELATDLERL